MVGVILTMWSILQEAAPFLRGKEDHPKLKNVDGPLPLHYMQHARASADDLEKVWPDGHTICDDATGIPVARWSYEAQELQPVTGFTIQGLPVYETVPFNHPVWSTIRTGVPAHLGTPGSTGETMALHGPITYGYKKVPYVRGEKLVDLLGQYGPLEAGQPAPESNPPYRGPSAAMTAPALLGIASIAALAMGATTPGLIAAGAALLMSARTTQSRRDPSGGQGVTPGERTK